MLTSAGGMSHYVHCSYGAYTALLQADRSHMVSMSWLTETGGILLGWVAAIMAELIRVYLHGDKTKPVEGQPLNAGISGAAALEQLEKFNGPGGMQDPSGTFISKDDMGLAAGAYSFIPAKRPGTNCS